MLSNSANYERLLEKVKRQRREIKRKDEATQQLLVESLERRQLLFESKRKKQKALIERYRKKLSWSSSIPFRPKLKPKSKLKNSLEIAIEMDREEDKGQIFGLTEVIAKPRASLKKLIALVKDNSKADFMNLSPRYIVDKIAEAQKRHEKAKFKGIGLESTAYYRKYMSGQEKEEKDKRKSSLQQKYLRSMKVIKRANEHVQSINRIREQMRKVAEKKNSSLVVVLEANLDNAFHKMDQDLNRVTAYAKYSLDFP
eukprot:TRINITY_DN3406_c0_g1_i7.p1 TRINITY_DN3406_c0_g1~~TRINITY_DN3406_c0_g1_i7.p1  ORF type:complete len:255 (-),score=96.02 TRINITY_DN3406_c0_g1_i7:152-916(-)